MWEELKRNLCDVDFVDIRFIDFELRWLTRNDFIENGKTIKAIYKKMNYNQMKIYKWYCYANIHTSMYQKNKIWDYLNDDIEYEECKKALLNNGGNYGEKL